MEDQNRLEGIEETVVELHQKTWTKLEELEAQLNHLREDSQRHHRDLDTRLSGLHTETIGAMNDRLGKIEERLDGIKDWSDQVIDRLKEFKAANQRSWEAQDARQAANRKVIDTQGELLKAQGVVVDAVNKRIDAANVYVDRAEHLVDVLQKELLPYLQQVLPQLELKTDDEES
ncbi:MAG: hypothetical protein OXI49_13505 [Acidobacteriota bacterium]|nr:hypothetical protein [Acidobacteriota bacterium]